MNNDNMSDTNVEQVAVDENPIDNEKLKLIVKRILTLEKDAVNNHTNSDEVKKKIMKIIEEELQCN